MDIKTWQKNNQFPLIEKLKSLDEVFWGNPNLEKAQGGIDKSFLTAEDTVRNLSR